MSDESLITSTIEDNAVDTNQPVENNIPENSENTTTNEQDYVVEENNSEFDFDIPTDFISEDGKPDVKKLVEKIKEYEKGVGVPTEDYDDKFIEDLGLSWGEGETALEWRKSVNNSLKDAKISQEQFQKIMPLYHRAIQNLTGQFGPPVNLNEEKTKLQEVWSGDAFNQNMSRVSSYAKNLPPEIFKYPLNKTAAGMQLLAELAKSKTGPQLIRETDNLTADDYKSQLQDIINDPAYFTNSPKGKLLQQKAEQLSQKINSKRRN